MPATPEQAKRRQEIADILVRIESEQPGSIRVRPNPYLIRAALVVLARAGFKKRLFQLPQQFVINSFLSDSVACDALLGDCALIGPRDDAFGCPAWSGVGGFRGWLNLLPDFQPNDRILFAINISAIVLYYPIGPDKAFYDLLEPPTEDFAAIMRAAEHSGTLKRTLDLLAKLPKK